MSKITLFTTISVIVLSIVAGAAYQALCAPQPALGEYLMSFASSLANGVDHNRIFVNSLKDSLLTVTFIFICGFARFGFLLSLIAAARRCFVSGFTCGALIGGYGLRGIFAAAAAELPFMLTIAPVAALCAFSVSMSFSPNRRERLKTYIPLTLACILISACAALCESYVVVPLISLTIGGA